MARIVCYAGLMTNPVRNADDTPHGLGAYASAHVARALDLERVRQAARATLKDAATAAARALKSLDQRALDIPQARPALLTPELRRQLDVLRRFRHRVRHAYDEEYDWHRMAEPLEARAQAAKLLPSFFSYVDDVVRAIIRALRDVGDG